MIYLNWYFIDCMLTYSLECIFLYIKADILVLRAGFWYNLVYTIFTMDILILSSKYKGVNIFKLTFSKTLSHSCF